MKDKIRLAVLNNEAGGIRELLLTQRQVSLLWEIADNEWWTAAKLAEGTEVSIQNASSKLQRFYQGGYLYRREDIAPSGGLEFHYAMPPNLKDRTNPELINPIQESET